jgi:hypothetical protein
MLAVLGALLSLSLAAQDFVDAPLIKDAVPLDEPGRYRSPKSLEETFDYYQRLFATNGGGVRWRNIVNLPGIKAKHVESLKKKTKWEGINLYEYKGEVRIYVVPRDVPPPPEKPAAKAKTTSP